MLNEAGPTAIPSYAQGQQRAWLITMGCICVLLFATTVAGLLVTRRGYVWIPIAAFSWQLYYFTRSTSILSDHFSNMSDLFTIRVSDVTSPIFLPFVAITVVALIVIPTLGLRIHNLVTIRTTRHERSGT